MKASVLAREKVIPSPKPCRKRGCRITTDGAHLYHVSREGHQHRGQMPSQMAWQRDVVPWAANIHGIMGWS